LWRVMQMSHRHLPFPVRDTGDLKRAIRYVQRAPDESARRYLINRARALGHSDLLPTSWIQTMPATATVSLDQQLERLADQHHISTTQLKTVYMRGVNEFVTSDVTYGSATMYGLARVQRFINERGAIIDTDLVPESNDVVSIDPGVELSSDSFFSPDVFYSSGKSVAELFYPGVVTSMTVSEEQFEVYGEFGEITWCYVLDINTGEHLFRVQ
jgi:hypothetical protein